jgi:hypothetical protein
LLRGVELVGANVKTLDISLPKMFLTAETQCPSGNSGLAASQDGVCHCRLVGIISGNTAHSGLLFKYDLQHATTA